MEKISVAIGGWQPLLTSADSAEQLRLALGPGCWYEQQLQCQQQLREVVAGPNCLRSRGGREPLRSDQGQQPLLETTDGTY